MAGVHRDLEELQTSYSAFETEKLQDPDDDEDAPPRFQQQSPARPAFWLQGSGMPRQTGASQAKEHGDQDHPPGGVIIHTVPEESKSRWSHIDDLDSFFKNVYTYHQKSGFKVMLVQVRNGFLRIGLSLHGNFLILISLVPHSFAENLRIAPSLVYPFLHCLPCQLC